LDYVLCNVVVGSRTQWRSYFTAGELIRAELTPYITHDAFMKMLLTRHHIFTPGTRWAKDFTAALKIGMQKFERYTKHTDEDETVSDNVASPENH
jgi:hypothetical protein